MKFQAVIKLIFAILIALSFTSCIEGPRGERGLTGPQGERGPQGPVGPQGEAGNANVKSYLYQVSASHYRPNSSRPEWEEVSLTVPAISSSVVNDGMVAVYLKFSQGWRALPFTYHYSSGKSTSMIFFYDLRKVLLRAWATDGDPDLYGGQYKVVVVDGGAGKNEIELDWTNHDEIMEYYGLPK